MPRFVRPTDFGQFFIGQRVRHKVGGAEMDPTPGVVLGVDRGTGFVEVRWSLPAGGYTVITYNKPMVYLVIEDTGFAFMEEAF